MIVNHTRMLINQNRGKRGGGLRMLTLDGLKRRSAMEPGDGGTRAEFEALCAEIDRRRAKAARARA